METKFTPGPWEIDRDSIWADINGHAHKIWVVGNIDTGCAIIVLPEEDVTPESEAEITATANLIATAPELYDALDEIVSILRMGGRIKNAAGPYGHARAVLSKARGDS